MADTDNTTAPPELKIKIQGKEYPFPSFETINYAESKMIKKHTGVRIGRFIDDLEAGDTDALMAIALIAKQRGDRGFDIDAMYQLTLSEIEIVVPKAEDGDADGPLDGNGVPAAPTPTSDGGGTSASPS